MRYSVANLKDAGFEVKIDHFRKIRGEAYFTHIKDVYKQFGDLSVIDPHGGVTTVIISNPLFSVSGFADCRQNESYNRKVGVKIAIARALKRAGVAYQHNRLVYFSNGKEKMKVML